MRIMATSDLHGNLEGIDPKGADVVVLADDATRLPTNHGWRCEIMRKTYTDFSQLSKGMFRKSDPVVEAKPEPPKKAAGEDALAYFGLRAAESPTHASSARADNGRIEALEANVVALRVESAALDAAKSEAERKSDNLEQQLAAERQMRASAVAERDRLRGEVQRLKNELEEALTVIGAQPIDAKFVREKRIEGRKSYTEEKLMPC